MPNHGDNGLSAVVSYVNRDWGLAFTIYQIPIVYWFPEISFWILIIQIVEVAIDQLSSVSPVKPSIATILDGSEANSSDFYGSSNHIRSGSNSSSIPQHSIGGRISWAGSERAVDVPEQIVALHPPMHHRDRDHIIQQHSPQPKMVPQSNYVRACDVVLVGNRPPPPVRRQSMPPVMPGSHFVLRPRANPPYPGGNPVVRYAFLKQIIS